MAHNMKLAVPFTLAVMAAAVRYTNAACSPGVNFDPITGERCSQGSTPQTPSIEANAAQGTPTLTANQINLDADEVVISGTKLALLLSRLEVGAARRQCRPWLLIADRSLAARVQQTITDTH